MDLRDLKTFCEMKQTTLVILDTEANTGTTLSLEIRSPFEVKTRLLPSIEAPSDEQVSIVYSHIAFCVEVSLEHVIEPVNNFRVSLEGLTDLGTWKLKKQEELKWRFEVCVKQDQIPIESLMALVELTLADATPLSFTQTLPPFVLKPSPVVMEVTLSEQFEKGIPGRVRVLVQNRSEISQNITVKLRKDTKRWMVAGVMEEKRMVETGIGSDCSCFLQSLLV